MTKSIAILSMALIMSAAIACESGLSAPPAGDYRVLERSDSSLPRRSRLFVRVHAPTATTGMERVAIMMDAALKAQSMSEADVVAVRVFFFPNSPIVVASVNYATDGCGWTGDDCTGEVWADAHVHKGMPSPEEVRIMRGWYDHKNESQFMDWLPSVVVDGKVVGEPSQLLNEERLKQFLAEKYETTLDYIAEKVSGFLVWWSERGQSIELSDYLKRMDDGLDEEK